MSDTDSFINEVSEEVRRDRLYALFRRYVWVAVLAVAGIVGGAAWLEYSRAQERAAAEAFGDALLAALDAAEPADRVAALEAIPAAGPSAQMVIALLAAGEVAQGGADATAAAAALRAAAEAPDLPRRYRDLAILKAEMLAPSDPATARLVLGTLAEPGAPYAALAEEQLALMELRAGEIDAALDRLRALERSAAATAGLQQRASQLIVALEAGSTLVDTGPAPAAPALPEAFPLGVETPAPAPAGEAAADAVAPEADAAAPEPETPAEAGDAPPAAAQQ
jgi:hypothetical protein